MIDFLIKSAISLTFLLSIYHFFLEKEKMHTFNRFYLLFSLLFSFALPFITIEITVEAISKSFLLPDSVQTENETAVAIIEKAETNYLPLLLWSLYSAITILFIIRFGKNISRIVSKIRKNRTVGFFYSTLVLIKEKALPHTFLQYIFINGEDFDNRNIQEELYTHELTHVRQGHSYDILFIEILKTIFWFNPTLYFYKKAIQLNHEFLADENVVESHKNVPLYQSLLLEKAQWDSNFYLASNLNFSVTKKRLIMMTKTTSKSRALLKKLLLLPILAGLIFILCLKTTTAEAQPEVWVNGTRIKDSEMNKPISYWKKEPQTNEDAYFAGVRFLVYKTGIQSKNKIEGKDILLDKLYEELTPQEKDRFKVWLRVPKGYVKKSPTATEFEDYKNGKKFAIWIDNVHVSNNHLNQMKPSDIAYVSGSSVLKNARSKKFPQPFQFYFFTHDYFDKNEMGKAPEKYPLDRIEVFEKIEKKKGEKLQ